MPIAKYANPGTLYLVPTDDKRILLQMPGNLISPALSEYSRFNMLVMSVDDIRNGQAVAVTGGLLDEGQAHHPEYFIYAPTINASVTHRLDGGVGTKIAYKGVGILRVEIWLPEDTSTEFIRVYRKLKERHGSF